MTDHLTRMTMHASLPCSAARWSEFIDPVTGRTVGQQLMLNQSYKTSMGYKWGGLAVVVFASFLFNALVWAALALLPGERQAALEPTPSRLAGCHHCHRRTTQT